jgi:hypothetical protein
MKDKKLLLPKAARFLIGGLSCRWFIDFLRGHWASDTDRRKATNEESLQTDLHFLVTDYQGKVAPAPVFEGFAPKVSFSFSPGFSPVQEQRSIEKPFQRFS